MPRGRGCSFGSSTRPPPSNSFPKLLGLGWRRDLGPWESSWGGGLFWADHSSWLREMVSVGKSQKSSSHSPLWFMLESSVWARLARPPWTRGAHKTAWSPRLSFGLTSLTAYSYYISVCSSAFWLGSHRNSAFIFWVVSEASLNYSSPPANNIKVQRYLCLAKLCLPALFRSWGSDGSAAGPWVASSVTCGRLWVPLNTSLLIWEKSRPYPTASPRPTWGVSEALLTPLWSQCENQVKYWRGVSISTRVPWKG